MKKQGEGLLISVYRTTIGGKIRWITITWRRNIFLQYISLSIRSAIGSEDQFLCKIELKPWNWYRRQGSKKFLVDGKMIDIVWDFHGVKFVRATKATSNYFVAVVCDDEVVLVLGDLRKEAYRTTRRRPSLVDPVQVSRTEHIFGKRDFTTKFGLTEIFIKWVSDVEPKLEIKVDGLIAMQVKHLQWKFRGIDLISIDGRRIVEVWWDVHDWLFNNGVRYGLFMFKIASFSKLDEDDGDGSSSFILFVYTWTGE